MKDFDYCIIGGGFAGTATAYYLAGEIGSCGRIVLLEQEGILGAHASGQNASMLRQSVPDSAIGRMVTGSVRLIRLLGLGGRQGPHFDACGALLLALNEDSALLESIVRTARENGLTVHKESKTDAVKRVPFLKEADFQEAVFSPEDGVVDIKTLLAVFVEGAKKRGVEIWPGSRLADIERKPQNGYRVGIERENDRESIRCRKLVNAAGAWSNRVAELCDIKTQPLKSCRRHLFFGARPKTFDPAWPYIWDLSHQFYARSYADTELLLSPCDEEEYAPVAGVVKTHNGQRDVLGQKLTRYMPFLSGVSVHRVSAELRTLSKDGRFVIGPDPEDPDFFWVSGLGGHGVTASAGVGELTARLLTGQPVDEELVRWFSPARFRQAAGRFFDRRRVK